MPSKFAQNPSNVDADDFARSLGLAITPAVPQILTNTAKDNVDDGDQRESIRKQKNVNRSLHKLKEQIKAAKESKKALQNEGKKQSKSKSKQTKEPDDSSEDELLKVKSTNFDKDLVEIEMKNELALQKMPRNKKIKLNMDGETKKSLIADGPKKIIFDEDGNAMDMELKANQKVDNSTVHLGERVTEHALRIKNFIDKGRKDDDEREKQRIKEKRKKQKLPKSEDERESEVGVQLHSSSLGTSDSDDSTNDDDADGFDFSTSMTKSRKRKNHESDESSSDVPADYSNDDDKIEEQEKLAEKLLMQKYS